MDTGEQYKKKTRQFYFEKQWLKEENFLEKIAEKWSHGKDKCPKSAYSLDKWHSLLAGLRKFLKGWGNNLRGDFRRRKDELINKIKDIDALERAGMDPDGKCRADLESELETLIEKEELYWQQRGG